MTKRQLRQFKMAARRPKHIKNGPDIFISHSNRDEKLAAALIKVCESVFPSAEIRCSSVSGYRFKSGDYRQQLRQEVDQSKTFIALLTPASIRSIEVLCEVGARWGKAKQLISILAAGAEADSLKGLLRVLQAISCEDYKDIAQAMQEMATTLGRSFTASARFKAAFKYLAKESVAKAAAYYPRLQIKDGKWGIGNKHEDVTDLLKSKILGDRLFYEASREFLGTDPAFGVGKYLTIHFTFDGEERKIRIPEGDRNILPPDLPP